MASSQQATLAANSQSGDLLRSSSSALNLSELYNMPMMNLQPNYFHSGPAQSQQQQQQHFQQQQQGAFGAPVARVAPPVPTIRVAPPPPVQPAKPAANTEPSFDSLFSVGGFETSGPGWDNPPAPHAPVAPHAPAPSGFSDLKVFEKNSAIVEAIVQNDGLTFTPIVDTAKTSKFHEDVHVPEKEAIVDQKNVKDGDSDSHQPGTTSADANGLTGRRGFFKWGPLGGGATPVKKQDEHDAGHSEGHQTTASKEHHADNEYARFLGEGQVFKAKLIGFLEVPEARGDVMCQDALTELKMRIRATGEHKQKIQIQVTVDGLKIKDEKSGDCVYHHPVQKISFIVQDLTDNRAFGYVFGTPDKGHRFFGIKTEKAASQVVLAMKDLFQVVFELKKKQIEEIAAANQTENPEKTEVSLQEPIGSFPDGFDVNYPSEEASAEPADRPQLMSQFSLESPAVDVISPLQQQQHQQQRKDTSSSALSELMGLQIAASPSQEDFFHSGMFQQQNFQQGFANSSNPNISGIQFGNNNPFGGNQQQHTSAFAQQQASFFGQQQAPGFGQQNVQAFAPPASSALNPFGIPSSYSVGNPFQSVASTGPTASSVGTKYGVFDNLSAPAPVGQFGRVQAPVSSSENVGFPKPTEDLFSSSLLQPLNSNPTVEPAKSLPSKESKPLDAFMDLDPIGKTKPFVDKKDFFSNMRQQTSSPMLASTPMKATLTDSTPNPPAPSTNQQGVESLLDWTFA